MIGRFFRLFLLLLAITMLIRWLFNREQRQTARQFVHTLAYALLGSSILFLALSLIGIRL